VSACGRAGGANSLVVCFWFRKQHCLTALIAFGIVEQLLMWFDFYRYNDEGTVCILFRPVYPTHTPHTHTSTPHAPPHTRHTHTNVRAHDRLSV
jgi:hypothetical protein